MKYALKIYHTGREPELIDFRRDMKGAISAFTKTKLSHNDIMEVHLLSNGEDWMTKYIMRGFDGADEIRITLYP